MIWKTREEKVEAGRCLVFLLDKQQNNWTIIQFSQNCWWIFIHWWVDWIVSALTTPQTAALTVFMEVDQHLDRIYSKAPVIFRCFTSQGRPVPQGATGGSLTVLHPAAPPSSQSVCPSLHPSPPLCWSIMTVAMSHRHKGTLSCSVDIETDVDQPECPYVLYIPSFLPPVAQPTCRPVFRHSASRPPVSRSRTSITQPAAGRLSPRIL